MLEKINFLEVSKIHPAFSGLLVDWSIGSREITATITNLIIKNNIFVVSNKLVLNNLNTKYAFEKEFLKIIFENKKELSFLELSSNAYNKYYRKLLTLISKALVTEEYIVENVHDVITKNLNNKYSENLNQKMLVGFLKLFNSKGLSNNINFLNLRINFNLIRVLRNVCIIFIIFSVLFNLILFFIFSPFLSFGFSYFITFIIFPIFLLVIFQKLLNFRELFNINIESILTDKGKKSRQLSLDLYEFIKKYPHLEDRLANELVSYSISFGIGTDWIKRLGVGNVSINNYLEKYNQSSDLAYNYFDLNKFLLGVDTKDDRK